MTRRRTETARYLAGLHPSTVGGRSGGSRCGHGLLTNLLSSKLGHVSRTGGTTLLCPRDPPARLPAVALAVVAAPAQEEPPTASPTADRPYPQRHVPAYRPAAAGHQGHSVGNGSRRSASLRTAEGSELPLRALTFVRRSPAPALYRTARRGRTSRQSRTTPARPPLARPRPTSHPRPQPPRSSPHGTTVNGTTVTPATIRDHRHAPPPVT
jgi:hypothetical protein